MGIGIVLVLMLLPFAWRAVIQNVYGQGIVSAEDVESTPVTIVYGAAVYRNGRLSSVLRDRMDTAIELYHAGKTETLLLSGDNSSDHYDEPEAMRQYALANGVADDDILTDPSGLRTYDTCYRARYIFEVEEAILVTQTFHLPRALFTCTQMDMDVAGVSADKRSYRAAGWYEFRETIATAAALYDTLLQKPATILDPPPTLNATTN